MVERGIDRRTGRNYALKVNVFDPAQRPDGAGDRYAPARLHPCLVRYYGAFVRQGQAHRAGIHGRWVTRQGRRAVSGACPAVLAAIAIRCYGLGVPAVQKQFHDIKPPNVLVNRDGEVKLTDFGISRSFEDSMSMAQTLVGTIMYMSPERTQQKQFQAISGAWAC